MNIIVSYYQFSISSPYTAGPHTLTAGEAQALNLLRADNFRKVAQRQVSNKVIESASNIEECLLSPKHLEGIQDYLYKYAETFEFKYRELENRKSLLQQELEAVAHIGIDLNQNEIEAEARRRLLARSSAISPTDLGF